MESVAFFVCYLFSFTVIKFYPTLDIITTLCCPYVLAKVVNCVPAKINVWGQRALMVDHFLCFFFLTFTWYL